MSLVQSAVADSRGSKSHGISGFFCYVDKFFFMLLNVIPLEKYHTKQIDNLICKIISVRPIYYIVWLFRKANQYLIYVNNSL